MIIHGDDIFVTIDISGKQQPIAASKSCDLNLDQSFIKICAPNEGHTFHKLPTTYDWGITCDCLMTTSAYAKIILDALRNGTKLSLQFIAIGMKLKGDVYIKSCNITATKGNLAKMNVTFESSGPLNNDSSWDFFNGTLYTYSDFNDGTLTVEGSMNSGTLQQTPYES